MPVGRPSSRTGIGERAPINEIGSAFFNTGSHTLTATGMVAPWIQFIDEMESVPELRWPVSVPTYSEMRRDSQLAALLTATMYGCSQLRFVLDPNGARDSLVNEIAEDLNVPIKGKDDQPKRRMKHRFSHAKHVSQAM